MLGGAAPRRLKGIVLRADTRHMATAALEFQPIFVYIAVGLSSLVLFTRIVLSWAIGN